MHGLSDPIFPECADCPVCGGIGYIQYDVPVGHPLFGRLVMCPRRSRDPRAIAASVGVDAEAAGLTLDGLWNTEGASRAVPIIRKRLFGERFVGGWVTLWGAPGTGKTTILKAAVLDAARAGFAARYTTLSALMDDLRAAYDENAPDAIRRKMREWGERWQVLALNEADKIKTTEFARERLFALLDRWYERAAAGKMLLLISANQPPEAFPEYIRDRMEDGRFAVVNMGDVSVRKLIRR